MGLFLLLAACGNGSSYQPVAGFVVTAPLQVANESHPSIRWTHPTGGRFDVVVWGDAARTQLIERLEDVQTGVRMTRPLPDDCSVWVEVLEHEGRTRAPLHEFCARRVPAYFPQLSLVQVDPARASGGYKLFNLMRLFGPEPARPILVLVNAAAEIVWWYEHPQERAILEDARALPEQALLFIVRDTAGVDPITSVAYEMSWDGVVAWRSRPGVQVHHEVGPGPDNGWLCLTYRHETVDGITYEGDGLELIDRVTGDVRWSWNLFDHFRPEDHVVPESARNAISGIGVDWSHSNAAVWDPTRGLIWVSVRNFDRLIGIEYPSGAIRVTIGQDGLGGPDYMSRQHAPEIQPDGSILLWDNGTWHMPAQSRAKQFRFDEATGAFEPLFEWSPSPALFDRAVGDADRLPNGNILVTAGVSGRIFEVEPSGDVVWELAVSDGDWIYRAQQVPPAFIPSGVLPE